MENMEKWLPKCGNCHLWLSPPEWALRESNTRNYGSPLEDVYCVRCVGEFVAKEIANGVRNPDGSFKS
jgi:hypothetical protein